MRHTLEGHERLGADVVLDTLRVRPRDFLADADGAEEIHHDSMPAAHGISQSQSRLREEDGPVGPIREQTRFHQPRDRLRDRHVRDAEPPGDVHRPRFAVGVQEIGDNLDVILGRLLGVGLARLAVVRSLPAVDQQQFTRSVRRRGLSPRPAGESARRLNASFHERILADLQPLDNMDSRA